MADIYKQAVTSKTDMIAQLAEALKEERTKRAHAEQRLSELECVAQEKHNELMRKRTSFLNESEEHRAAVSALRREITSLQKLVESIEQVSPEDEEYYLSLLEDQHRFNVNKRRRPPHDEQFATPLLAGSAEERFSQRIRRIEGSLAHDKKAHAALLAAHDDSPQNTPIDSPTASPQATLARKIATIIFARRLKPKNT